MNSNKIKNLTYLIIIMISIFSCNNDNKKSEIKKIIIKKSHSKIEKLKKLKTDDNFIASDYKYDSLSIKIPKSFKKKSDNLYFQENGTNLLIGKDYINTTIKDYIKKNFNNLKKNFSNTIKEGEKVNINNHVAKYIKYVIDRKKYLIQIETILIQQNKEVYIVTISGKKKYIDSLSKTIKNIFSTIKLKEN